MTRYYIKIKATAPVTHAPMIFYIESVRHSITDPYYPMCCYTSDIHKAQKFTDLSEARKTANKILTRKTRPWDNNITQVRINYEQ